MLPRHLKTLRHRLYAKDLQASLYASFVSPLKKLGFRPCQRVLVFRLGIPRPLGAYVFVHRDGRRLYLYFSRSRPYRYTVCTTKTRHVSPFFTTFADLEQDFCRYFKIRRFIPDKITVPTWPLQRPKT